MCASARGPRPRAEGRLAPSEEAQPCLCLCLRVARANSQADPPPRDRGKEPPATRGQRGSRRITGNLEHTEHDPAPIHPQGGQSPRLQKMHNPTGAAYAAGPALPSNPRARWVTEGRQRPLPSNPGSKLFFLAGTSSRRPAFSAAWLGTPRALSASFPHSFPRAAGAGCRARARALIDCALARAPLGRERARAPAGSARARPIGARRGGAAARGGDADTKARAGRWLVRFAARLPLSPRAAVASVRARCLPRPGCERCV